MLLGSRPRDSAVLSAVSTPGLSGTTFHTQVLAAPAYLLGSAIRPGLSRRQRIVKRALDIGLTIPAVLLLAPLFLLIGLAIYLGSGRPIIYRVGRVGQGGRIFGMYKFRTMIPNAERRKQQAPIDFPDRRLALKTANDPRITRIGSFLRRTSLDELPQLLNVLLGQMSLVGPRPEQPYIAVRYEPWQRERWSVPQGITGLWQIRGRSLRPLHKHTDDDLEYIRKYSLWLDLSILVQTVAPVLRGTGAF